MKPRVQQMSYIPKAKDQLINSNIKKKHLKTRSSLISRNFFFDSDEGRELLAKVGTRKQNLEGIVNKVVERSLFIYRNQHCHTCSILLSQGKSTYNCPKCHHLLGE